MANPFSIYNHNTNALSSNGDAFGVQLAQGTNLGKGPGHSKPPGNSSSLPKRPSSAGHKRPQSAGRVSKLKNAVAHSKPEDEDPFASMSREDLLFNLYEAKRRIKNLEYLETQLRADNQRWELEFKAQQKRVDRLLDPSTAARVGGHMSAQETKKEIEKSTIVRQLKQLVVQLRTVIIEKDSEIENLKKSQKSVKILELTAEKEEYYVENLRLRQLLQDIKNELVSERQRREWAISAGNAAMAVNKVDVTQNRSQQQLDIKQEISKLSNEQQNILRGMSQGAAKSELRNVQPVTSIVAPLAASSGQVSRPHSASAHRADPVSKSQDPASNIGRDYIVSTSSGKQANILDLTTGQMSSDSMEAFVPVGEEASVEFIGDIEPVKMQSKILAAPTKAANSPSNTRYQIGQIVEGLFRGGTSWYGAKIKSISPDGLYHLQYLDGDEERNMTEDRVRVAEQEVPTPMSTALPTAVAPTTPIFAMGSAVEGNYKSEGTWYKGVVNGFNAAGNTYSIRYEDGDEEDGVTAKNIKACDPVVKASDSQPAPSSMSATETSSTVAHTYKVGDLVEGKIDGTWKSGKVTRVRLNQSIDILFDDGLQEAGIKAINVRYSSAPPTAVKELASATLPNNTVVYVAIASIVASNLKSNEMFADVIDPYIVVEFDKFKGQTTAVDNVVNYHWKEPNISFAGTIEQLSSSGVKFSVFDKNTFKKDELSGTVSEYLPMNDLITLQSQKSVTTSLTLQLKDDFNRAAGSLEVSFELSLSPMGAKTAKPLPTTQPSVVEARKPSAPPKISCLYPVGSTVEGNYRGEGYWYRGQVSSFNDSTGFYSILYDDGDQDVDVPAEWVRIETATTNEPTPAIPPPQQQQQQQSAPPSALVLETASDVVITDSVPFEKFEFTVGDKVDANYRCKGNWYSGEITSIDENGLYSITYDDDEVETSVHGSKIRYHVESPRAGAGYYSYGTATGGEGDQDAQQAATTDIEEASPDIVLTEVVSAAGEEAAGYQDKYSNFFNNADDDDDSVTNYKGGNIIDVNAGDADTEDWKALLSDPPEASLSRQGTSDWMASGKYTTEKLELPQSVTAAPEKAEDDEDEYGEDFD